jgi:hypothetical protein
MLAVELSMGAAAPYDIACFGTAGPTAAQHEQ